MRQEKLFINQNSIYYYSRAWKLFLVYPETYVSPPISNDFPKMGLQYIKLERNIEKSFNILKTTLNSFKKKNTLFKHNMKAFIFITLLAGKHFISSFSQVYLLCPV